MQPPHGSPALARPPPSPLLFVGLSRQPRLGEDAGSQCDQVEGLHVLCADRGKDHRWGEQQAQHRQQGKIRGRQKVSMCCVHVQ